jgi:hypothetical protein
VISLVRHPARKAAECATERATGVIDSPFFSGAETVINRSGNSITGKH